MDATFPKEEEDKGLDQELPVQINENAKATGDFHQELLVPIEEEENVTTVTDNRLELPEQMEEDETQRLSQENHLKVLEMKEGGHERKIGEVLPGQLKGKEEPRLLVNNERLMLKQKEKDGTLRETEQELSVVEKEEEEEMEVSVTNPIMTLNKATPPYSETHPEKTRDEQMPVSLVAKNVCIVEYSEDEEETEDSDSDSSSSSSSSSSSPSRPLFEDDDDEGFSQPVPVKSKDEICFEELPAVDELSVTLPAGAELQPVGTISSIIQQLVIVQSMKDTPPLNDDSIIFKSDRLAVGKVFEVFGPVSSPLYILRFNSNEEINSKGLTEGMAVYYAPTIKEYTEYVLPQQLKLMKGSDASWKNDQEPPEEVLDYSDDEKEKEAKRKAKNARKPKDYGNTESSADGFRNSFHRRRKDSRGFPPRHAGPPFSHQDQKSKLPSYGHPPAGQQTVPPVHLPPPCPYPLPPPLSQPYHFHPPGGEAPSHFAPPSFPLYPPGVPPLTAPPPSYFNPAFSSPPWPPNFYDFLLSQPPPPPPPPPPPSQ